MISQAVVLVGGLGTRLEGLTAHTPKPMLQVGDRPFVRWLVAELCRQGVTEVLLSAGHKAEKITDEFRDDPFVDVIVEPEPLGTGGALRYAANRLQKRFLFLNGDSLFDIDLADLAAAPFLGLAMLALREVDDVSRYGAVETEGDRIVAFGEHDGQKRSGPINGGVAILDADIVSYIDPSGPVSLEADIYPQLARQGLLGGRVYDRAFIDIGIPADFNKAQTFVPGLLAERHS